jgi:hypothetical protein
MRIRFALRSIRFLPLAIALGCGEGPVELLDAGARAAGEADGTFAGRDDVEVRVRTVEAYRGDRPAFIARFAFTTVEGDSIFYALSVSRGAASLVRDETRDGGGISTVTFQSLELVRFIPSVWVNNQEIAKERYEAIDVSAARGQTVRILLRGRTCADAACDYVF